MKAWAWVNMAWSCMIVISGVMTFAITFVATVQQIGGRVTIQNAAGPALLLLPALVWAWYWRRPPQHLKSTVIWALIVSATGVLLFAAGDRFVTLLIVMLLSPVILSEAIRVLCLLLSKRSARRARPKKERRSALDPGATLWPASGHRAHRGSTPLRSDHVRRSGQS